MSEEIDFHILNTSGIFNYPNFQYDAVRIGIGFHGYANNIDWDKCFELIKNDKKVKNGKINWILLESLGKAVVRDNIDKDTIFRIFGEM